jgi:outer membrane protein assembly factor BamB
VLYYNRYGEEFGNVPLNTQGIIAVDLHTGEELWFRNNTRLAFGQKFYWDNYNFHGVFDYLWETIGSTWNSYDAFTGDYEYTMTNVPSGVNIFGPKGEIFRYTVDLNNGWMTLWNSSRVVSSTATGFNPGSWGNTINAVSDRIFNATNGIEWNVTIPTGLPGSINDILADRIIGSTTNNFDIGDDKPDTIWSISIAPGQEGDLLFNTTWQPPTGNLSIGLSSASLEDGVFVIAAKETRQYWGFDLDTGQEIWGPTDSQLFLDSYQIRYTTGFPEAVWGYGVNVIAYGKFLSTSFSGRVYAYDVKTGDLEWTYDATDPFSEILWSNNWPLRTIFVTDGKIYISHEEHSPVDPKPRGGPTLCLNVTTGEEIWRINGAFRQTQWGGRALIGDSIMATMDTYDQRIYAVGKGPSAITAEAPLNALPLGTSVTIRGTITDISPGTKDSVLVARFPNGVPVVADTDMSEWMLHVYKQFQRPAHAEGVEIRIQTIDPNGNYAWIGTTTSDSYGNYAYSFVPQIKGQYTIITTFVGSKSYYGSETTTHLTVDPAPEPYPIVTIPPYPEGVTAEEVAQEVVSNLPEDLSADEVAQEILAQLPEYPEITEYTNIDLIILVAIGIAIVVGIISFIAFRKQK